MINICYEECGIGLDQGTLPNDFEKPLKYKPINTMIVFNTYMQRLIEEIINSAHYDSLSDDAGDCDYSTSYDTGSEL